MKISSGFKNLKRKDKIALTVLGAIAAVMLSCAGLGALVPGGESDPGEHRVVPRWPSATATTPPPTVEVIEPATTPPAVRRPAIAATKPTPRRTTKRPTPRPTTREPESPNVYYANCSEVRAAGAAPLHRGEPGYRSGLDRDHDGVACES